MKKFIVCSKMSAFVKTQYVKLQSGRVSWVGFDSASVFNEEKAQKIAKDNNGFCVPFTVKK